MSEQSYDDSNMSASQAQPMAESSVGSQRTACFGTSVSTSPLTQRSQSTNQSTDSAPYNSNSVRGLAPEPRGEGSRHLTTVVEPTEPTSGTSRSYSMLNSSSCSDHTGGFLQDSTSDAPMKKTLSPKASRPHTPNGSGRSTPRGHNQDPLVPSPEELRVHLDMALKTCRANLARSNVRPPTPGEDEWFDPQNGPPMQSRMSGVEEFDPCANKKRRCLRQVPRLRQAVFRVLTSPKLFVQRHQQLMPNIVPRELMVVLPV